jgi:putative AlgH/UPF0301 family transcriptional regulator
MPGTIMTFYSYKGGTGRSMGLANTAWIMASNGHRVLVVDWDLEAPGLHRYFHPFLPDSELRSSPGVIELMWEFATAAVDPDGSEEEGWHDKLAEISPYAMSVKHAFPGEGTIDLVPAGRQDALYSTLVSSFDWTNFYQRLGGGGFLEALKRSMRNGYDYVLIDSRTGLSDTAGICTVQLPDILIDCFVLSTQAIEGAAAVAASVTAQRSGENVRIFPVPMRVEDGELDKLEASRDFARAAFTAFVTHLPDPIGYWGDVEVPYRSFYAYEEILATLGDRPRQENTLLAAFERLAGYLTDRKVSRLAPVVSEAERRGLLDSFQRGQPRRPIPGVDHVRVDEASQSVVRPVAAFGLADPVASRVVLIGGATYRSLPDVPSVANNVAGLADLLRDPELWGVPAANVRVLLNPADPSLVSRAVRTAAEEVEPNGLLLVYYAGHGLIDPMDGSLILATPDTDPAVSYEQGVPYEWLRRAVAASPARRRLVILDCSYAGRAGASMTPSGRTQSVADLADMDQTALLVSASANRVAQAPPAEPYTAFTGALLRLLREGVPRAGHTLTVGLLWREVRQALITAGYEAPELRSDNAGEAMPLVRNVASIAHVRAGDILFAATFVADMDLQRAVVLILRYDPDTGAMGVRINHPAAPLPADFPRRWLGLVTEPAVVFDGGPVARADGYIAVALLRDGALPPLRFTPVSGRVATVPLSALTVPDAQAVAGVRIFAGYLGWGPGQLEADLEEGVLVRADAAESLVLSGRPQALWAPLDEARTGAGGGR